MCHVSMVFSQICLWDFDTPLPLTKLTQINAKLTQPWIFAIAYRFCTCRCCTYGFCTYRLCTWPKPVTKGFISRLNCRKPKPTSVCHHRSHHHYHNHHTHHRCLSLFIWHVFYMCFIWRTSVICLLLFLFENLIQFVLICILAAAEKKV